MLVYATESPSDLAGDCLQNLVKFTDRGGESGKSSACKS